VREASYCSRPIALDYITMKHILFVKKTGIEGEVRLLQWNKQRKRKLDLNEGSDGGGVKDKSRN